MNMQQCPNGHFFDQSKFAQCPYCNPATNADNRTIPLDDPTMGGFGEGRTEPVNGGWDAQGSNDIGSTVAVDSGSGVTVAIVPGGDAKGGSFDPVMGWFVCAEGKDRGQDFRIYGGNNSIGRGSSMRIRIPSDTSISKENMAYVACDYGTRRFFFAAGDGRNLIHVNDELLLPHQSRELHAYDRIRLGETTLVFIPFCGEEFSWE